MKRPRIWRSAVSLVALFVFAGCAGRGTGKPAVPAVRSDLREAARRYSSGTLTGQQYLALVTDRVDKARRLRDDPAWRQAAGSGDRDHDGVPDPIDACPDTPALTPTDARGCPLPARPDCSPNDPRCVSTDDDRHAHDLADTVYLLFDPRCDGSPSPQTPQPLEWGRDPRGTPGTGFNLAVTRVDNQKPGCTLFYEIQFRYREPGRPAAHLVNVLFNATEDLSPGNPRRAVFALPMNTPLPPQRNALRDALNRYVATLEWRVRAVNGAEGKSPWSTPRSQEAAGGVSP